MKNRLFVRFCMVLLAALVLGASYPEGATAAEAQLAAGPTATVTAYALNVREGPGMTYRVIGWVRRGEVVELTGYRDGAALWVQIKLPRGALGWVHSRYLRSDYPFANLTVVGDSGPVYVVHVVQPGDTLSALARSYGTTVAAIMATNNLQTTMIYVGQRLNIPASSSGVVQPGDNLSGITPAQVVESFYSWYLEYARTHNPLVTRAYRTDVRLTRAFIDRVDRLVAGGIMADPFLCAQDVPERITTGNVQVSGNQATVTVNTSFTGHSFVVNLVQVDGRWLIDGVMCGQ
jgi:LysM repeat protein